MAQAEWFTKRMTIWTGEIVIMLLVISKMISCQSDRCVYDGEWVAGYQSGQGSMRFRSGDTYTGGFMENVPHGSGQFLYPTGDTEDVVMEAGLRHGQSRYSCQEDGTVEEVMFWEGAPRGPSKVKCEEVKCEDESNVDISS